MPLLTTTERRRDTPVAADPSVPVIYGASIQSLPLAGLTLGEARNWVREFLHVGPKTVALINGAKAGEDYRLVPGDAVEFIHQAGEKG